MKLRVTTGQLARTTSSAWSRIRSFGTLAIAAGLLAGTSERAFSQSVESIVGVGKVLFEREWSPAPKGTLTALGGDGLGPAFNDRSCVACHVQGGVGGGGPLDKNVDMLNLPSEGLELTVNQGRQLQKVHPGFVSPSGAFSSSIVLHKFVLDDSYGAIRRALLREEPLIEPHPQSIEIAQHRFSADPVQPLPTPFGLTLVRAQRNTSSLFGSGLIDQVPDNVLLTIEKQQPSMFPGISGRAAPAPGGIGRFGWRAKTARLSEFVLEACANELGLQVENKAQGMVPSQPDYRPTGRDLSTEEGAALVAFVAALPPPRRVIPDDSTARSMVREGRLLFGNIGCAACHMETLGPVQGLYSDLLLHDMGPALSDPAPAQPDIALHVTSVRNVTVTQNSPEQGQATNRSNGPAIASQRVVVPNKQSMVQSTSAKGTNQTTEVGYYGGASMGQTTMLTTSQNTIKVLKLPTQIYQEWRTPPLWGVQDSAPYLHDGRAATLVEAIAWHGGEAQQVTNRYFNLPAADRLKVLAFLRTLRAPNFQ